jgi:hypothetical protein
MSELVSLDDGSLDDVMVRIRVYESERNGVQEGKYLGHQVRYWCVGCGYMKQIPVSTPDFPYMGKGAKWSWNSSLSLPVLAPSQLHRTYEYPNNGTPEEKAEADRLMERDGSRELMMNHKKFGRRCHTFIGMNGAPPGHVIFLNDCTHAVRGVHRLLPRREWPQLWAARMVVKADSGQGLTK